VRVVGIETDRAFLVRALVAAGYRLVAVNPLGGDRCRDRVRVSGTKSDPGDARVLAAMVRTDAHRHRQVAAHAHASQIQAALRTKALTQPALVADAYGAIVAVIGAHNTQIADLEEALHDHRRAAGDIHSSAPRVVGNRLVGVLHGCLRTHTCHSEETRRAHRMDLIAA